MAKQNGDGGEKKNTGWFIWRSGENETRTSYISYTSSMFACIQIHQKHIVPLIERISFYFFHFSSYSAQFFLLVIFFFLLGQTSCLMGRRKDGWAELVHRIVSIDASNGRQQFFFPFSSFACPRVLYNLFFLVEYTASHCQLLFSCHRVRFLFCFRHRNNVTASCRLRFAGDETKTTKWQ